MLVVMLMAGKVFMLCMWLAVQQLAIQCHTSQQRLYTGGQEKYTTLSCV